MEELEFHADQSLDTNGLDFFGDIPKGDSGRSQWFICNYTAIIFTLSEYWLNSSRCIMNHLQLKWDSNVC